MTSSPHFVGMLGGRFAPDRPGVVDENIDDRVRGFHFSDESVERRAVAEIARVGEELLTQRGDGAFRFTARLQRRAHADDVRPGLRERERHGPADAAFRAGDQRSFSVETELMNNAHRRLVCLQRRLANGAGSMSEKVWLSPPIAQTKR